MSRAVVVRRLQACDVEDYRIIRLAALEMEPDAFGSVHAIEAIRPIAEHAERLTASIVLGAYHGGNILGMIGFRKEDGPKDSHKGFVWGFYVQPWGRRQGVGSALISALIEASRGVVEQLLLTVVQGNEAPISLYRRFGFSVYGVESRALKSATGYSDEVLMSLIL